MNNALIVLKKSARIIAASICCILIPVFCIAQEEDEESEVDEDIEVVFKNTFFTGGSLGLQFGTVTMVDISPQAGYYILEHWSVGVGFTYQYISDKRYHPSLNLNIYGGRLFTRLYFPFFDAIFAHGEYEYLTYRTDVFNPVMTDPKKWIGVTSLMAGAGYRQRLGARSALNLMLLWNFNESEYTLYSNPIIRMSVDIGL